MNKVLGDTADWKSAPTVSVAGRVDSTTIVSQAVRVSIRASSTRPQVTARRLIVESAAIEEAAPSSVKRTLLYITISIIIPTSILVRRPKTTSNTLFY